ncbi:MAG: acyltransferase [Lysobacterales bacterium]
MSAIESEARNGGIDALRGGSILLVIVHHLALGFRLPLGPSWLGEWLPARLIGVLSYSGYAAVYCFFVISGFLITRRLMLRYGDLRCIELRRFYRDRASRILPLLLALLLVLSVLHGLGVPGYVIQQPGQSLGGAWLAALGLHLNWYEGQTTWLPGSWDVLWSLSIEELYYLIFPLACLLLPRPLLLLSLGALVLSLPWTRAALDGQEIWQEKAYLPAMSAIAVGVLAAQATQWPASRGYARCLLAIGVAVLLACLACAGELWRATGHASLLVIAGASALVLLGCDWLQAPAPPGLGWLARMGRLSYELYLTHMFVVLTVVALWHALLGDAQPRWNFLPYLPALLVCVALAAAVERYYSKPCERWLRRRSAGLSRAGL